MDQKILIKQSKIINPDGLHHRQVVDIEILNGTINLISKHIPKDPSHTFILENIPYLSCGWIDTYCELREPGNEIQEDLTTLDKLAKCSGFSHILGHPNTIPILQKPSDISFIIEKCQNFQTRILPFAATSKNFDNSTLTEFFLNKEAGCVGFSQGKKTYDNVDVLVRALRSAESLGLPVVSSPLEISLANSFVHESENTLHLGFKGQPSLAETSVIVQQIEALKYTEGHLHFTGISSKESVEIIRQAKKESLNISCDVSINNLCFTELQIADYNSLYKTNPPLRTEEDRTSLIAAINDGTIDCIASYHQPVNQEKKALEIEYAEEGILGLQTFLPMYVKHLANEISLDTFIDSITKNPQNIFQLEASKIEVGEKANLVGFDLDSEWLYHSKTLHSKVNNHPYYGQKLKGEIRFTFCRDKFYCK